MSMETEVWAPWKPKVGDRVRVRLSGECQARGLVENNDGRDIPDAPAHEAGDDGLVGLVDYIWHESRTKYPTHPYEVIFPPSGAYTVMWNARFAAIELEPLDARDV